MFQHIRCVVVAVAVGFFLVNAAAHSGPSVREDQKGTDRGNGQETRPADSAAIDKLIRQLGSEKFAEREAALKRLEEIGEPALEALREAAKKNADPEVRRGAGLLADRLVSASLPKLLHEGAEQERQKNYKKAAELLDQAIKRGLEKAAPDPKNLQGTDAFLAEVFLHSARVSRELKDFEKADNAYSRADYFGNYKLKQRQKIARERVDMMDDLLAVWQMRVRKKVDGDPALKKLAAEHSLVVLHSRRYAGGGYLESAYSFLYKTADEEKHYNDVQLLFDNGREKTIQVNMVTNQENRVADLEDADFGQDPDPEKVPKAGKNAWQLNECLAVEGHVYLEKVEDSRGNLFFVVFKVVAVDKESRYMAFIWRQLPGGKVVRRP